MLASLFFGVALGGRPPYDFEMLDCTKQGRDCLETWSQLELRGWHQTPHWNERSEFYFNLQHMDPALRVAACDEGVGLACTVIGAKEHLPERLLQGCQRGDPDGCAVYALALQMDGVALTEDDRELVRAACRTGSTEACAVWLDGLVDDPTWGGAPEAAGFSQFACRYRNAYHACVASARFSASKGWADRARLWIGQACGRGSATCGDELSIPLVEYVRRTGGLEWLWDQIDVIHLGAAKPSYYER